MSRQDFLNCSIDDKLMMIDDKLTSMNIELKNIKSEQVSCNHGIESIKKTIMGVNNKLEEVIVVTNAQSDFMKILAYKSIDLEARSRRNNLIFRGLAENRSEDCFNLIRDFIGNHLDLDPRRFYIARAHRLGRFIVGRQVQRRPIIVNFRDHCDIEEIMSKVTMLRDTPFSIDYDYPKEIQQARSRLWPRYKQLKSENRQSKIQIVYPAKLIQDGRIVKDELPDWNRFTNVNRLEQIDKVVEVGSLIGSNPTIMDDQPTTMETNHLPPPTAANSESATLQRQYGPPVPQNGTLPMSVLNTSVNPINPTNCPNTLVNDINTNVMLQQQMASLASIAQGFNPLFPGPFQPIPLVVSPHRVSPQQNIVAQSPMVPMVPQCSEQVTHDSNINIPVNINPSGPVPTLSDTELSVHHVAPVSPLKATLQSTSSDETCVKTIENSPCNPPINTNTSPCRGRSRAVRASSRSEKRSQSSKPYKRQQSESRTREKARGLPASKNRPVTQVDQQGLQQVNCQQTTDEGTSPTTDNARL